MPKQLSKEQIENAHEAWIAALKLAPQEMGEGAVIAITAIAEHVQYSTDPSPLDQSVVEEMCEHYDMDGKRDPCGGMTSRMTAAATVLVDRMLGPVTDEERREHERHLSGFVDLPAYYCRSDVDNILTARRDRLLRKPEPTLEEEILALLQSNTCTTTELAKQMAALVERRKAAGK